MTEGLRKEFYEERMTGCFFSVPYVVQYGPELFVSQNIPIPRN